MSLLSCFLAFLLSTSSAHPCVLTTPHRRSQATVHRVARASLVPSLQSLVAEQSQRPASQIPDPGSRDRGRETQAEGRRTHSNAPARSLTLTHPASTVRRALNPHPSIPCAYGAADPHRPRRRFEV
ncbi:hypothetical protein DENSPDRAFT_707564 [Dentipellis sp. KUC8613]|nr:hypothetical protein DENSPDRAFT_707564 [Dentipellis sp. KUC8613]